MGIGPPEVAGQRPAAIDIAKNRLLFVSLYSELRRLAENQLRRNDAAFVRARAEAAAGRKTAPATAQEALSHLVANLDPTHPCCARAGDSIGDCP
jgi:hypothetical protein